MYKFIKLTNGKDVQAFYEADESQVAKIAGSQFDFKDLADGKIAQKIAFVDADGNKVNIFNTPLILNDGNTVKWFDYLENVTKDGSDLASVWDNKTGINGIIPGALLQAVEANQPLWTTGGMLFPGVQEYMATPLFTFNQPEMIYIVFKQLGWTHQARIFDGGISVNLMVLRQYLTSPDINIYAGITGGTSSNLPLNTFGIVRTLFNGASSELIVDNNTPIVADAGLNNSGGFTLGANTTGLSGFSNIQVKEIILRKIADTAPNQQIIYDYLANKYSI